MVARSPRFVAVLMKIDSDPENRRGNGLEG